MSLYEITNELQYSGAKQHIFPIRLNQKEIVKDFIYNIYDYKKIVKDRLSPESFWQKKIRFIADV